MTKAFIVQLMGICVYRLLRLLNIPLADKRFSQLLHPVMLISAHRF
jgi:hypothetical protein